MQRSLFPTVIAAFAAACGSDRALEPSADNWPDDAAGPAGMGMGVRVFGGTAATLSEGTACTSEEGAEGDRWCVFVGRSEAGDTNLFTLNVSQVMAGVPVSCGAYDPNCLLLAENIGGSGGDWHPTFFEGDTLVYYDQLLTPYAWRPGMEAGRLLANRSSELDIAFCSPAPHGTAIACLALPSEQEDAAVVAAELYAGAADGESEPLLTPIDSVIAATNDDTTKVHRFSFGFPTSGYVAWTSRQTPEGVEVLKLQRVDDPESQVTIASDVHEWSISTDGTAWLWQSGINELGIGMLQTAPFPDGAYPTDLLARVLEYRVSRNGSVIARTEYREAISILDPIGAPDQPVFIDSDVYELVGLSDQGHIAYAKGSGGPRFSDAIVASLDGTSSCVLEGGPRVSLGSVHFSPGSGTVLWARADGEGYGAYHSRPADCSTVALSEDVAVLGWMGSAHAVFIDDLDPDLSAGSLRYRKVGKNGAVHPEPAIVIAEHVDTYSTWGEDFLLYTINQGTEEDGLYLRAFGK